MSKNHSTLIHRYPGKNVPEEQLRAVLKARPSAGGYAVQAMENGEPILIVDHMNVGVELEAVQEILDTPEYKDSHFMLAFHQFDKFSEDDMQPHSYVVDGDSVDLAVGIEGDIPTMIEGDVHPETKLFKTVILPNLNKFRKYSAGDLKAFMDELNDPTFKDMIMARIGVRGYLCFLPPVGEPVWFGKEKFGSSFPWGQVSNTHGYVETPATQTVAVSEKRVGWFSKNKGPTLPVAQEPAPTTPAEAKPPLGLPEPKPDTKIDTPSATPVLSQPEGTVVDLPGGLKGVWKTLSPGLSTKDRKAVVRRVTNCGSILPEGFDKPGWTYLEIQYPSRARDLPDLKEKLEQQQRDKPVADAGTKLSGGPTAGMSPTRGSEVVHEANIMVLTAEELSAAETSLLKIMDRQGKEIPPALELQKLETKYPKFTGKFGMTLGQINNSLPEDVAGFFKENGKASFHLYLETRGALREAEAALAAIGDNHTKGVETLVIAKDELKPEKKTGTGGWGNWKK